METRMQPRSDHGRCMDSACMPTRHRFWAQPCPHSAPHSLHLSFLQLTQHSQSHTLEPLGTEVKPACALSAPTTLGLLSLDPVTTVKVESESCSLQRSTLCNPMDCSLSGSSVHGILQARILWSELPFPSPGDVPNPGIELGLPHCRQIHYFISHPRMASKPTFTLASRIPRP